MEEEKQESEIKLVRFRYSFTAKVALEVGVDKAIILENIYWWVLRNQENNRNYHDGYFWTYNSARAYKEQYPFWGEDKIQKALKSLADDGYILKGNYNKVPYDHTLWHTLSKKGLRLFHESIPSNIGIDSAKSRNRKMKTAEPIPVNIPIKNTVNIPSTPNGVLERFERFWKEYPRKVAKGTARKWFEKHKPSEDLVSKMIEAIERQKTTPQWKEENGKYIPYPATWLNSERWEDDTPSKGKTNPVNNSAPDDGLKLWKEKMGDKYKWKR